MSERCICNHSLARHPEGQHCRACECQRYREVEWVRENYADFGEEAMVDALIFEHQHETEQDQ